MTSRMHSSESLAEEIAVLYDAMQKPGVREAFKELRHNAPKLKPEVIFEVQPDEPKQEPSDESHMNRSDE